MSVMLKITQDAPSPYLCSRDHSVVQRFVSRVGRDQTALEKNMENAYGRSKLMSIEAGNFDLVGPELHPLAPKSQSTPRQSAMFPEASENKRRTCFMNTSLHFTASSSPKPSFNSF